jgi:DNA topoisomerase VI subunit B
VADDDKQIRDDFHDAVNMTAKELEKFLETDESKEVGQKSGGSGESTGHESGRRIVELLGTKVADLTDDDHQHMKKVTGYVKRHLAQGPSKNDVEDSNWRYSLMNWGHDPLKDK